jgi:Fe-S-cluster-containing dehydrogenase component
MPRYGMVMDVTKCNGCYNCFLACKDEHCEVDHLPYAAAQPMTGQTWMRLVETERGQYPKVKVDYTAVPCMHCDAAPCLTADGAVYRRDDGIVLIDPVKAAGQKSIAAGCPYRVIFWNEATEMAQKCTMCAHLLDAGYAEPRCVEACPTGALVFGNLDDPESAVAKALAAAETETLRPEFGLAEKVRYVGLPKSFIAGAVVFGDRDECADGVTVTLTTNGETDTAQTDSFGDFEFDGLPANAACTLQISVTGYEHWQTEVKTTTSLYLGDIVLEAPPLPQEGSE